MKALLTATALAVALLGLPGTARAVADPGTGAVNPVTLAPPFVEHTEWTQSKGLISLRVFPTPAARMAARQPGSAASADEAWAEVLALSPDADTAGMRAQFSCHWQFAELAQPGKTSWNLEPWRPVVDDADMFASGCNPGGSAEAF
ncbi:DUF2599 domain-containing protein [Mycobacterium sp.]|uniref:DUF2599 domain-containing protein n=1 Tax=Mycobacterium sp. TaxID=1785 RepID=UPI003C77302E